MGEDCCAPSTVMHKRQFQGSLDRKCNTATIQRQNKRSQQPDGLFVWGINLPKNNEHRLTCPATSVKCIAQSYGQLRRNTRRQTRQQQIKKKKENKKNRVTRDAQLPIVVYLLLTKFPLLLLRQTKNDLFCPSSHGPVVAIESRRFAMKTGARKRGGKMTNGCSFTVDYLMGLRSRASGRYRYYERSSSSTSCNYYNRCMNNKSQKKVKAEDNSVGKRSESKR